MKVQEHKPPGSRSDVKNHRSQGSGRETGVVVELSLSSVEGVTIRVVSEDSGGGAGKTSTVMVASLLTGRGESPDDEAPDVGFIGAKTGDNRGDGVGEGRENRKANFNEYLTERYGGNDG